MIALVKANLQSSKVIRRIKNLGLDIAASKTGVVVFNDKNKTKNKDNVQNIHNTIYNIYIDREIVAVEPTVKYLGLILDKDWSFMDHFTYIENKISRVSRALYALMPNLRGPRERKRRLYAHVIASIINWRPYMERVYHEQENQRETAPYTKSNSDTSHRRLQDDLH